MFGHREHIELAWRAVREYGMPEAADRVCERLREMTAYLHAPQKYHHTMSRAWVQLVAHHASDDPFEKFIADYPALLDKRLLARHYRSTTLAAQSARTGWVKPDLLPLPDLPDTADW